MRLQYFIFIAFLTFTSLQSKSQTPDSAYEVIKLLNLDTFATKPVDSFLNAIPQTYSDIKIIGSTRSDKAIGLSIYYPSGLSVWIKPKNFSFMNRVDPNRQWNLTLFKKETSYLITVTHPDFPSLFGQQ